MNKENILQLFKESYENKTKVDRVKITKFIEDTTPILETMDKDVDYYKILYYRLAIVLELDLEVKGIDTPNMSQEIFTGGVLECISRLESLYDRYKNSEVTSERLSRSIQRNGDIGSFALDTKDKNILLALEKYIGILEKYNEC
ncbi:hypothetical protein UT300012_22540 [Paraclostridium bifermentans]